MDIGSGSRRGAIRGSMTSRGVLRHSITAGGLPLAELGVGCRVDRQRLMWCSCARFMRPRLSLGLVDLKWRSAAWFVAVNSCAGFRSDRDMSFTLLSRDTG